jgi:hypothetical protein
MASSAVASKVDHFKVDFVGEMVGSSIFLLSNHPLFTFTNLQAFLPVDLPSFLPPSRPLATLFLSREFLFPPRLPMKKEGWQESKAKR